MEILIGFRDPNTVAIKEFYEFCTKLNYFAILINDKNDLSSIKIIDFGLST